MSPAELFAAAERHLPPSLADGATRERLAAVAADGRGTPFSSLWLECRLATDAGRVDLSLRARRDGIARLAALPAVCTPGEAPLWRRIRTLARRWGEDGAFRGGAAGLWLEHDVDDRPSDGAPLSAPGVFVQLVRGRSAAELLPVVFGALEALLGGAPPPALARHLRACILAGASLAEPIQVGVMLSRPEPAVRLCFLFRAPVTAGRLLARLGWSGGIDELEAAEGQGTAGPFSGVMMLHVDVGADGLLPRVGIDHRLDPRLQPRGTIRERGFLDTLVRARLADPLKAAGLLAWPGARRVRRPDGTAGVQARRVSHVKLTSRPGAPLEAKAYLAFHAAVAPAAAPDPEPARRTLA